MIQVGCKVSGCGWDTRGSAAGAGGCVDMRSQSPRCLLSLVCEQRFDGDEGDDALEAVLVGYASTVEPTPGRPHTEEYRRGEEKALMYVNAEGIVSCSAELLRELLGQAGWERVS